VDLIPLKGNIDMELVSLSLRFESAFLTFCEDFAINDIGNAEFYLSGKDDLSSYIQSLTDESHGVNLREGYVPCS
jgi:predicted acetyltransferase